MIGILSVTCNGSTACLGVDANAISFSWVIDGAEQRDVMQQRYHLQISTAPHFQDCIYDSQWVASGQSQHVAAAGFIPLPEQRYFFRVRVEDNASEVCAWSQPGWLECAPDAVTPWQAQWISPDDRDTPPESVHLLRKTFHLRGKVKRARLYASALGIYQLQINEQDVSDALFSPGWTSYQDHIQYQVYDVTALLTQARLAIGARLAEGWYKGELSWLKRRELYGDCKALFIQLQITYEDGTEQRLISDQSWQCRPAGQSHSSFYHGERWDARVEPRHWAAGADSEGWRNVEIVPSRSAWLVPQIAEPVRVTEHLTPRAIVSRNARRTVIDMGQNMVGRVRLRATLQYGERVVLRHAEVLDREGELYTANLRGADQRVEIVGNGEPLDYAAQFSFQGFRYLEIQGLNELADERVLASITGEVLHTDMQRTGHFQCSRDDINQLYQNIIWGQRGNFVDIPTDCPQRDERLGWTGDAHIFMRTAALNYNIHHFFSKWLRSLAADQKPDGSVPMVIPDILRDYISKIWGDETYTSSGWGDAAVICPWTLYQTYGDKALLAKHWPSMKAWVHYIHATGNDPWVWNSGFQFGDWLALDAKPDSYFGATPVYLVANAFYAHVTNLLSQAAQALGLIEDARRYREWFAQIKARFVRDWLNERGEMKADTQTAHILPLAFHLLDEAQSAGVAQRLHELVAACDYHLDTGFLGTPYLCPVLSEYGYHQTAVRLLCQTTFPSWLFSVHQGATTIWEHWDGIKSDGSFWSDNMNSFNHYAYGAVGEWLYRYLAGLDFAPDSVGGNRIVFRPDVGNTEVSSAEASYLSPYGEVAIRWQREGAQARITLKVPANAQASLLIPTGWHGEFTPEGRQLQLGSGEYALLLEQR